MTANYGICHITSCIQKKCSPVKINIRHAFVSKHVRSDILKKIEIPQKYLIKFQKGCFLQII